MIVEFFSVDDANPDRTTSTGALVAIWPPSTLKPVSSSSTSWFVRIFAFFQVLTKYGSVLVVIDYNVKASCFAIPCKAPAVEVEMMFSTAGAVFGAVSAYEPSCGVLILTAVRIGAPSYACVARYGCKARAGRTDRISGNDNAPHGRGTDCPPSTYADNIQLS